jgi:hypothetical protein
MSGDLLVAIDSAAGSRDASDSKYIYFGNLFPAEDQYKSGLFRGLSLHPKFDRDIPHDARHPMAFSDNSVEGFQSQDVFEHIEFELVAGILDDIYRCMTPGGIFRLSLPDYNGPLLRSRSVYDCNGKILHDSSMGGAVSGQLSGGLTVTFPDNGDAHLWFPTYANVLDLIVKSQIRKCTVVNFYHYWLNATEFVCKPFDQSIMPVIRTPPRDMRAQGKPISLVVDFVK